MGSLLQEVRTIVTFHTFPDGGVDIIATGRHGTLTLHVGGDYFRGPSMDIPDLDKEPGRPLKFKGMWSLQANGKLKGWLADDNGVIRWFPVRPERKPLKRPATARRVKK